MQMDDVEWTGRMDGRIRWVVEVDRESGSMNKRMPWMSRYISKEGAGRQMNKLVE